MTAREWVAIGIAVGTFVGSVVMWLVSRKSARQDKLEDEIKERRAAVTERLEEEVFGRGGLRADIAAIGVAGEARERRIVDTVNAQAVTIASEMQELRTEVSEERQRLQRDVDAKIAENEREIRELGRRVDGFDRRYRT